MRSQKSTGWRHAASDIGALQLRRGRWQWRTLTLHKLAQHAQAASHARPPAPHLASHCRIHLVHKLFLCHAAQPQIGGPTARIPASCATGRHARSATRPRGARGWDGLQGQQTLSVAHRSATRTAALAAVRQRSPPGGPRGCGLTCASSNICCAPCNWSSMLPMLLPAWSLPPPPLPPRPPPPASSTRAPSLPANISAAVPAAARTSTAAATAVLRATRRALLWPTAPAASKPHSGSQHGRVRRVERPASSVLACGALLCAMLGVTRQVP